MLFKKPKPITKKTITYATPGIEVMSPIGEPVKQDIFTGSYITNIITSCGCACEFIKYVLAPQAVTYHFRLKNIGDITKLKKPITALSAMLHTTVTQTSSDCGHFALVIPPLTRKTLKLQECLCTTTYNNCPRDLRTCLGVDANNTAVVLQISNMPHMLIAGATGSGKSVLLNSIIVSLLYSCTPNSLRFVMIDPKKVELSKYEGLPHLEKPIAKDHSTALNTLQWVCDEMDRRYNMLAQRGFKKASEIGLPSLVVVIDELADLMLTSKYECEQSIIRIAQLGRSAGIHLIIATQRPTVNVITGLIKSNIPCKIALQVASIRDSINILDHKGGETLTGRGDALLKLPDRVEELRFQSAYISDEDIERVVKYWINDSIK